MEYSLLELIELKKSLLKEIKYQRKVYNIICKSESKRLNVNLSELMWGIARNEKLDEKAEEIRKLEEGLKKIEHLILNKALNLVNKL
jgi:adenylate kinase